MGTVNEMKRLLILALLCSLFACQKKEVVFTLVEPERGPYIYRGNVELERHYYYDYFILAENIPKDKMELKRLMIQSFLEMTSAMDSMRTSSDLYIVSCMFLKPTLKTKQRFRIEARPGHGSAEWGESYTSPCGRNADDWYNNETYIGTVHIRRCEENTKKLVSTIRINLGTTDGYRWSECCGPDGKGEEIDILLSECEPPSWYVHIKDPKWDKHYKYNKYDKAYIKYYDNDKDNELVKLFNTYYKRE